MTKKYDKEKQYYLVVFLILECEPHPEDTLLCIFLATVRYIAVFVRDFLIVLREEENAVFCRFYSIADCIRLDKVHGSDQVRNLMDDADQTYDAPSLYLFIYSTLFYDYSPIGESA